MQRLALMNVKQTMVPHRIKAIPDARAITQRSSPIIISKPAISPEFIFSPVCYCPVANYLVTNSALMFLWIRICFCDCVDKDADAI
jgi:hypothetical protein